MNIEKNRIVIWRGSISRS